MSKQYSDSIGDDAQESLVQALESIKGLLEKSESKLSAARESIALANDSSRKIRSSREEEQIPVLSEEVLSEEEDQATIPVMSEAVPVVDDDIPTMAEAVPLLDEIIADTTHAVSQLDEDIPVISEAINEIIPPATGIECDDVLDLVDEFQARLKPIFNQAITSSSILQLESVLNEAIEKELRQLRNEIKQLEQD